MSLLAMRFRPGHAIWCLQLSDCDRGCWSPLALVMGFRLRRLALRTGGGVGRTSIATWAITLSFRYSLGFLREFGLLKVVSWHGLFQRMSYSVS